MPLYSLDELMAAGGQPEDAAPPAPASQTFSLDDLLSAGGQPETSPTTSYASPPSYSVPTVPQQSFATPGPLADALRPRPLAPAGLMERYQGTGLPGTEQPLPPVLATPAPGQPLDPSQPYQPPAGQQQALGAAVARAQGLSPGLSAPFASGDPRFDASANLQELAPLDLGFGAPARQYVDAVGQVADLSRDVTPLYEARKQATVQRIAAGDKRTAGQFAVVNVGPDGSPNAPTTPAERAVRDRAGSILSGFRQALADRPDQRAAAFGGFPGEAYDLGDGRLLVTRAALGDVLKSSAAPTLRPADDVTPDWERGLNAAGVTAAKAIGGLVEAAGNGDLNPVLGMPPQAKMFGGDWLKQQGQQIQRDVAKDAALDTNTPTGAAGHIAQAVGSTAPMMLFGATPLGPAYAAAQGLGGMKAEVSSALRTAVDPKSGQRLYSDDQADQLSQLAAYGSAALNYGMFSIPGFKPTGNLANDVAGAFAHGSLQSAGTAVGDQGIRAAAAGTPFDVPQAALEGLIGGLTAGGLKAVAEGFRGPRSNPGGGQNPPVDPGNLPAAGRRPAGPTVDDPAYDFGTPRTNAAPAPGKLPEGAPPDFPTRMSAVADAVEAGRATWDDVEQAFRWVAKEGRPLGVADVTITPADAVAMASMLRGKAPPPRAKPVTPTDDPAYDFGGRPPERRPAPGLPAPEQLDQFGMPPVSADLQRAIDEGRQRDQIPAPMPADEESGFDAAAWDRREAEIADRVKDSKKTNQHLDDAPKYVETLRGKKIRSLRDGSTGVIRTVANTGDVVVNWDDEQSAKSNLASQVDEKLPGKRKVQRVWQSWVIPSDQSEFVIEQPTAVVASRRSTSSVPQPSRAPEVAPANAPATDAAVQARPPVPRDDTGVSAVPEAEVPQLASPPADPFVARVGEAARAAVARHGPGKGGVNSLGDKVTVEALYAEYQRANGPVPLARFKQELARSATAPGIDLVREDNPAGRPGTDFARSEVEVGASRFHYLRVPEAKAETPAVAAGDAAAGSRAIGRAVRASFPDAIGNDGRNWSASVAGRLLKVTTLPAADGLPEVAHLEFTNAPGSGMDTMAVGGAVRPGTPDLLRGLDRVARDLAAGGVGVAYEAEPRRARVWGRAMERAGLTLAKSSPLFDDERAFVWTPAKGGVEPTAPTASPRPSPSSTGERGPVGNRVGADTILPTQPNRSGSPAATEPRALAPGAAPRTTYTPIPAVWHGAKLDAQWALPYGESLPGPQGRGRSVFPPEWRRHFQRVDGRAKPLVEAIRARTDEVLTMPKGVLLAPKQAVAEARAELAAKGVDEAKAKADTIAAEAQAKEARRADRERTEADRAQKVQGIEDRLRELYVQRPGAPKVNSADAARRAITGEGATLWGRAQPNGTEAYLLAYLRDHARYDPRGTRYKWVEPSNLADGAKIKVGDETLTVHHPIGGETVLKDGITAEVPAGVTVPAREVVQPPPVEDDGRGHEDHFFDADRAGASEQGSGLFGQPTFEGATGRQQGGLFTETRGFEPSASERVGSRAANDPANTGEMFPGGRRPGARGGYVDLGSVIKAGGIVGREATALPRELFSRWSAPLIEVVEKQAGAAGKEMANLARLASDDARAYMGQFEPALDRVLRTARGLPWDRAGRRALANLEEIAWQPAARGEYGVSRFREAVEGRIADTAMSPAEFKVVDAFRKLMEETGRAAAGAGMKAFDHVTGRWVPFVPAKDGKRLIRRPTDEYYDLMVGGKGTAAWDVLADALANMNGIPKAKALQELEALSQQGLYARGAFESFRTLKQFPDYLRVKGQIVPLLHATPFSAASSVARTTALRLGYAGRFGQDVPGTAGQVSTNKRAEAFVRAGGKQADAENLLRALNGIPIDAGRWFEPGDPGYLMTRGFDVASAFLQGAALSKNFIPNTTEIVGKIPAMFGAGRTVRALTEALTSFPTAARESARSGARSVNVANLRAEPGKMPEHVARVAGHAMSVVGHFVNEFNELVAARAGKAMADDLAAGKGTELDRSRLRVLGYSDPEIAQLMAGAAPPKLARSVETRAAEATQGSTSLPAELSRARNSRTYRRIVNFDSYAQMTANRTARVLREPIRAMASGEPKRAAAGAFVASQYMLGGLLSGAGAILLGIYAKYGAEGVKQAKEQIAEHPLRFAREAMFQTLIAGPLQAVVDVPKANNIEDFTRTILGASAPLTVLGEMVEAANGWGKYRDMDPGERLGTLISRRFSAGSLAKPLGVAAGWRSDDLGREAAIASYWKWRREHKPAGGGYVPKDDLDHRKFRTQMSKANRAIREGKSAQEVQGYLDAAAGSADKEGVNASLRSRLLLDGLSDDERASLKGDVGHTAFAELEAFDRLVSGFDPKEKLKQELAGKPEDEIIDRAFDAQDAGRLTASQRRSAVKELTQPKIVLEVGRMPVDKAMQRFRRASIAERKVLADTLYAKIRRDRDHSQADVDKWLGEVDAAAGGR